MPHDARRWLKMSQRQLDELFTASAVGRIRDEIREISPGVCLGKVCWGRQRLIDCALEF